MTLPSKLIKARAKELQESNPFLRLGKSEQYFMNQAILEHLDKEHKEEKEKWKKDLFPREARQHPQEKSEKVKTKWKKMRQCIDSRKSNGIF